MADSAYLKHHVGEVLAKGLAATTVARPSDPQEYLGLWLLHHLQERDRLAREAAQQRNLGTLRQQMDQRDKLKATEAVKVIERFWSVVGKRMKRRVRDRQKLLEALEATLEEAAEEFPSASDEDENDEDDDGAHGAGSDEDKQTKQGGVKGSRQRATADVTGRDDEESDAVGASMEELDAKAKALALACKDARIAFQRSQYILQHLTPTHIGELKKRLCQAYVGEQALSCSATVSNLLLTLLATHGERYGSPAITMSEDEHNQPALASASEMLACYADQQSLQLLATAVSSHYGSRVSGDADLGQNFVDFTAAAGARVPRISADTPMLVPPTNVAFLQQQRAAWVGERAPVNMPLLMYRVMRSLCYLFFNISPKQASRPAILQQYIKPFLFVKQLLSFSPVSTYFNTGLARRGQRSLHGADDNNSDEEGAKDQSDEDDTDSNRRPNAVSQADGGGDSEEDEEHLLAVLPPVAQPRRRQVSRCARILRLMTTNNDYTTPATLRELRQEVFEELRQRKEVEEEKMSRSRNGDESEEDEEGEGSSEEILNTAAAFSEVEAEREVLLSSYVEEYVKKRDPVLWALLLFVRDAVQFRRSRDAYLNFLQQHSSDSESLAKELDAFMEHGLLASESTTSGEEHPQGGASNSIRENEVPEEEAYDAGDEVETWQVLSEEVEGEIDAEAVLAMKERFGSDRDETAVILWEAVEKQQAAVLQEVLGNLQRDKTAAQGIEGNSGEDDGDGEGEDDEDSEM